MNLVRQVYHGDALIRVLIIHPDRYYQPKPGKDPNSQSCQISSQYKLSRIIPVTHESSV
jgi:hypothetical protein